MFFKFLDKMLLDGSLQGKKRGRGRSWERKMEGWGYEESRGNDCGTPGNHSHNQAFEKNKTDSGLEASVVQIALSLWLKERVLVLKTGHERMRKRQLYSFSCCNFSSIK